ncbi:MAG: fluoride efflux transporter CrcB [Actinomycetota bacterium]|nr:fluoride efflux transporter CrcB [Actinomycetota bacterium]
MRVVWVGVGGFFGSAARYWVGGLVNRVAGGAYPWGTLVINVSGCFVLGLLMTALTERFLPHPNLRTALTVGFIGAYTTFSTFAFESVKLGQDGAFGLAVVNVVASVVVGLGAAWLGIAVGRAA